MLRGINELKVDMVDLYVYIYIVNVKCICQLVFQIFDINEMFEVYVSI